MGEGLKQFSRWFLDSVLRANYRLGNYKQVVWVIGDGRSGTTWVSHLLKHRLRFREMFEPFHPMQVERAKFLVPMQYIRADQKFPQLEEFLDEIVSGEFSEYRINRFNRSFIYKGILIKDIFANLLCFWGCQRHPSIKPILLMRNPFAVALSKYKREDWLWVRDPMDLWNQESLRQDYLLNHESIIRKVSESGDYIQQQLLLWAITNYVPMNQFRKGMLKVLFYENIFLDPHREIAAAVRFIEDDPGISTIKLPRSLIERPTRVAGKKSTLRNSQSPITSWKNELSAHQIDQGFEVLAHFGMDSIYGDDGLPNLLHLEQQFSSHIKLDGHTGA